MPDIDPFPSFAKPILYTNTCGGASLAYHFAIPKAKPTATKKKKKTR